MAGFQPLFFYASAELRCLMSVQLHEVEVEGFEPFLYIPDFRVDENAYATASLRQIVRRRLTWRREPSQQMNPIMSGVRASTWRMLSASRMPHTLIRSGFIVLRFE